MIDDDNLLAPYLAETGGNKTRVDIRCSSRCGIGDDRHRLVGIGPGLRMSRATRGKRQQTNPSDAKPAKALHDILPQPAILALTRLRLNGAKRRMGTPSQHPSVYQTRA